jgi:hypothetical protein
MSTAEMIEQMASKGNWSSPGGKTPTATLYSARSPLYFLPTPFSRQAFRATPKCPKLQGDSRSTRQIRVD